MKIILNCEDKIIMEEYSKILMTSGYKVHCILDEEIKDSNEHPTLRAIKKSKELFGKYNIVTISILKGMSEGEKEIEHEEYLNNHKDEICELISASVYNGFNSTAFEFKADGYAQRLESSIKNALNKKTFSKSNLSPADKLYQMDYIVALRARRLRYLIEVRSYSSLEYAVQVNKILNRRRIKTRIKELSRRY